MYNLIFYFISMQMKKIIYFPLLWASVYLHAMQEQSRLHMPEAGSIKKNIIETLNVALASYGPVGNQAQAFRDFKKIRFLSHTEKKSLSSHH